MHTQPTLAPTNTSQAILSEHPTDNFSLAKVLTDKPFLNFVEFVNWLTPLNPEEIQKRETLIQRLKDQMQKPNSAQISRSIEQAIFHQMIDPTTEACRELISNAIDAQVRAFRRHYPISISINASTMEIQDHGDGMGWQSLPYFLVPGQSLSRVFRKTQEECKSISGRFGQGGYTPFYYLLFERNRPFPGFKIGNKGLLELDIPFQNDKGKGIYRFIYTPKQTPLDTNKVIIETHPQEVKSLVIHSKQQETAIQMIFEECKQQLFLDVRESATTIMGTHFRIKSPLIEEEKNRIIAYLKTAFAFVEGTPIFLNNELINNPALLQSLSIEEGTLYFTPKSHLNGKLLIYEKGRLICEESLQGSVLETIAINFHNLNLTTERASINSKDPLIHQFMQKLIQSIISAQYPNSLKAVLFNSLYPFIVPHQNDLIPLLTQWQASLALNPNEQILPDIFDSDASKFPQAIFLHPNYCQRIQLKSIEAGHGKYIYLLPAMATIYPVFLKSMQGHLQLFIREDLLNPHNMEATKFNLFLLNLWLEQKINSHYHLDIPAILHPLTSANLATPCSPSDDELMTYEESRIQTNLESMTFEELCEEHGIENYLVAPNGSSSFSNFQHHSSFSTLFPQFWLLTPSTLPTNEEEGEIFDTAPPRARKDQLELFARYVTSSQKHLNLLTETQFFNFSDLQRVCLDATELPLDRFQGVVYLVFSYLESCLALQDKQAGKAEAERFLKFLTHTINLTESLQQEKSTNHYLISCYERFRTIVFLCNLTEIESRAFQDIEEYYGAKDYQKIEALIKKIPNTQAKHMAITLYEDLYPHIDLLLSLLPEEVEQLLYLFSPYDLYIQNRAINVYQQRIDSGRKIQRQDCLILIKYMAFLNHWPIEAKKLLAESFFLIELIKDQQFEDIDKQIKVNEPLFFEILIYCLKHKSQSTVIDILDQTYSSLNRIVQFYQERNLIYRDMNSSNDCKQIFQNYSNSIRWLSYYQSWETFSKDMQDFQSFLDTLSEIENSSQLTLMIAKMQSQEIRLWDQLGLLLPSTKPFIQAAFVGLYQSSLDNNFTFPIFSPQTAISLHKDQEVVEWIGSEDLAQTRIQSAIHQSLADDSYFKALITNSIQAGCTSIKCNAHLDDPNHLTISIQDNGEGIDEKGFKALKIPGYPLTPNRMGNGFFSALKEFDEAIVLSTSQSDLTKQRELFFKKEIDGTLSIQKLKEATGHFIAGTTIFLRKKCTNPFVDCLLTKSLLVNSCCFIQPALHFQGEKINIIPSNRAIAKAEIPYEELGIAKGSFHAFIGMHEGLFLNQIKISNLPDEAWDLIPKRIRQQLNESHLKVSLFLPQLTPAISRGHIVNQMAIIPIVQYAVLKVCMNYYLAKLAKGEVEKQFSDDYWGDFRFSNQVLGLDRYISNWSQFGNFKKKIQRDLSQGMDEQKQALLQAVERFLKDKQNELTYPTICPLELFQAIQEQDEKKADIKLTKILQQTIESYFIPFLVESPLPNTSHSFLKIRCTLFEKLSEMQLLCKNGAYNINAIKILPLEYWKDVVKDGIQITKAELGLNQALDSMFDQFKSAIIKRLANMKFQQEQIAKNIATDFHPLAQFLEHCAHYFLNRPINFKLYEEMDGTNAYTFQQTTAFHLNTVGELGLYFNSFKERHQSQNRQSFHPLQDVDLSTIMTWLNALTHECTHMSEPKRDIRGCQGTHDQAFRDKMCDLLTTFFITPDKQITVLTILENILYKEVDPSPDSEMALPENA